MSWKTSQLSLCLVATLSTLQLMAQDPPEAPGPNQLPTAAYLAHRFDVGLLPGADRLGAERPGPGDLAELDAALEYLGRLHRESHREVLRIIDRETMARRDRDFVDPEKATGELLAIRQLVTQRESYRTAFYRGDSPDLDAAWDERDSLESLVEALVADTFGSSAPEPRLEPVPLGVGQEQEPQDPVPVACVCPFTTRSILLNQNPPPGVSSWGATYQVSDGVCDEEGCPSPKNCQGSITISIDAPGLDTWMLYGGIDDPPQSSYDPSETETLDLGCGDIWVVTFRVRPPNQIGFVNLGMLFATCNDCDAADDEEEED